MLFTDGTILTIQDLREHDNFVLDVASTESIELSSKLAVAQRKIGYELSSFLICRGIKDGLDRVVVTPELRDLLAAQTLAIIYRDAYNTHLNDRYLGRWKEFARATEQGLMRLLRNGVGMAVAPVRQPSAPVVTGSDQGGLSAGLYYLQTAWQHIGGNVSERSAFAILDLAGGSLEVDPGATPANTSGWHIFIGNHDKDVRRQNEAPVAVGASWTQSAALRADLTSPEPSGPDFYVRNSDQVLRG